VSPSKNQHEDDGGKDDGTNDEHQWSTDSEICLGSDSINGKCNNHSSSHNGSFDNKDLVVSHANGGHDPAYTNCKDCQENVVKWNFSVESAAD